ncbi:MAG: response regulator [Solirubrobacterales bacterium]
MIRVLLAENHSVVRAGLEELLDNADDIEVVGAAADGEEAVALAKERRPEVILMDLSMPGMGGIEATRLIREAQPEVRILVLTAFSDRDLILGALDAGAAGYLLKDTEPTELLDGIRAAAGGEAPLAPKAGRALLASRAEQQSADLTDREKEVLTLVASGLANKLIARRLEISEKTVKAHLTKVFQRIGVSDRTQAALWAQRHRIGPSTGDGDESSGPADGGAAR